MPKKRELKKVEEELPQPTTKPEKKKAKSVESTVEEILDTDLKVMKVPELGPAAIEQLRDMGIEDVMSLAVANTIDVMMGCNKSRETVNKWIRNAEATLQANKLMEKSWMTGVEALQKRKEVKRITTGSKKLDGLLKGGIETKSITEFYGEFGAGKSQICHTLAVTVQSSPEQGGLDGRVIWIDTEGTFRPERVEEIAIARNMDAVKMLENLHLFRPNSSAWLELIVRELPKYLKDKNVRLVVIDSIISLHRSEFSGRGTLADRQQRISQIVHKLQKIAEFYKLAVVITNQVSTSPETMFGDPNKPTGGNIIAHASTYRISLKKSGENKIARMVDSPYHAYDDIKFTVDESGVTDVAPEVKKKDVEE